MAKQQQASPLFALGAYATAKEVAVALELLLEHTEKKIDIIKKKIDIIDKKIDALKEIGKE